MTQFAYSFGNITSIVGGTTIRGHANGNDVLVIEYESDLISDFVGADGHTVTNYLLDYRATITYRLGYGAEGNDVFNAINLRQRLNTIIPTPFLVRDSAGRDLHTAAHISLLKPPPANYGAEAPVYEWKFRAAKLLSNFGGGLKLA